MPKPTTHYPSGVKPTNLEELVAEFMRSHGKIDRTRRNGIRAKCKCILCETGRELGVLSNVEQDDRSAE